MVLSFNFILDIMYKGLNQNLHNEGTLMTQQFYNEIRQILFKSTAANNGTYFKCILIKLYVYIYKCIGTKCQWSLQVLLPPIGSKKNHDSTLLEH